MVNHLFWIILETISTTLWSNHTYYVFGCRFDKLSATCTMYYTRYTGCMYDFISNGPHSVIPRAISYALCLCFNVEFISLYLPPLSPSFFLLPKNILYIYNSSTQCSMFNEKIETRRWRQYFAIYRFHWKHER